MPASVQLPESSPPVFLGDQAAELTSRSEWLHSKAQQQNIGEVALDNLLHPLTAEQAMPALGEDAPELAFTAVLGAKDSDPRAADIVERIERLKIEPGISDEDREKLAILLMTTDPVVKDIVARRDMKPEHSALGEMLPEVVSTYEAGLASGISQGYIPADRQELFKMAAKKTGIGIIDKAILDIYDPDAEAYYSQGSNQVVLGHNLVREEQRFNTVLSHELTHQISGGTFLSDPDNPSAVDRSRLGFVSEVKPHKAKRNPLNEFLTQHITMGILSGDFQTFDPDERADQDKTYYAFRKVGAAFVDRAQGIIDPKVLTQAYFEDSGPEASGARRQLVRQIRQAYGKGALAKMDALFNFAEVVEQVQWGRPVSDMRDELILRRIKPPVLNAEGRVIEPGEINLEDMPTFEGLMEISERSFLQPAIV